MFRHARFRSSCSLALVLCGVVLAVASGWFSGRPAVQAASKEQAPLPLTIDYPRAGSIFPPEITAPTFLFHDSTAATRWVVQVSFEHARERLRMDAAGERLQKGELDLRVSDKLEWTAEQESTRTWKPDDATWSRIKRLSVDAPGTFTIEGYAGAGGTQPVSSASVTISASSDPVGAPIFYRNVPLRIAPTEGKGAIQPLPPSDLPLIKWELRDIGQTHSHTLMENLPTCANCHSFSRDGKTLGIDMDGPRNDKGLYALVPVSKDMVITNRDTLRWASFQEDPEALQSDPTVKRYGFMSQVSPDGRYVITSIAPPGTKDTHSADGRGFAAGLINRMFSMNYQHLDFTQVFYPTRGILAWYDRKEKKLRSLPGADDPNYVQTSAFWSPDGKYLIYSRAKAQDPYPPGAPKPTYANDPREPLVQYDLYEIPFNGGRGGRAEPVLGASANGMSNNFPKVSPDGRWIVFVQNRTGLLMRPDSRLFMVPFGGGTARLMTCNTPRMNSWHSFSPNGRWLAFSSKGRSPYTQLMLTHVDAEGHDSPAILVENTTAANRAVNIPEFVNVPSGGMEKIDPQVTEFYRLFNDAYDSLENNQFPKAIGYLRAAVARDPADPIAHFVLATALSGNGQEREALGEYRKASELNPRSAGWLDHLAVSLASNDDLDGAIATWRKALEVNPEDAAAETDLGTMLFDSGRKEEGLKHLHKAVVLDPDYADARNHLGVALADQGQTEAAIEQLHKGVELDPKSAEFQFNLGFVLESYAGDGAALEPLEQSVQLSEGKNGRCLVELAKVYDKLGRPADALRTGRMALEIAEKQHKEQLATNIRAMLAGYERQRLSAPRK